METDALLHELEQLVMAMEDSLAIIAGTISETSDPAKTLANLVAGAKSVASHHGDNEWRDRLLRSALRLTALKARAQIEASARHGAPEDPALRSLIASVLGGRSDEEQTH